MYIDSDSADLVNMIHNELSHLAIQFAIFGEHPFPIMDLSKFKNGGVCQGAQGS